MVQKVIFVSQKCPNGPKGSNMVQKDRLHRETMDFLSLSTALHSCQNILSEKEQWTGCAADPQGPVVQGGGHLPGD
jgi:hypothetical protein